MKVSFIGAIYLWIALTATAFAQEKQLLKEIIFPPNYHYAPNFSPQDIASDFENWQGKQLLLEGSGDATIFSTEELSASQLQFHHSESLRLAYRRAEWLRGQLVSLGLNKANLHLGSVADSAANFGGAVRIYAVE